MKLRKDGWPVVDKNGPMLNHSNTYIGFARGDEFKPFGTGTGKKYEQGWLDREALKRVRTANLPPISYYDAVLEAQPWDNKWHAVTYEEVYSRSHRVDNPSGLSTVWISVEDSNGDRESDQLGEEMYHDLAIALAVIVKDTIEETIQKVPGLIARGLQ